MLPVSSEVSSIGVADDVTHIVELPVFSGPLDLLLQLIEREELDITSVSLAAVTDQYLDHMRQATKNNLDNLADFMVVAARLILIKSQSLLPRPPDLRLDETEAGVDLARQLLVYRAFKDSAKSLDQRHNSGLRTYVRLMAPPRPDPELYLDGKTVVDLWRMATRALELSGESDTHVSSILAHLKVTVQDKINAIVKALRSGSIVPFFDLLRQGQARSEVVMTFLAILELVKMGMVSARQEGRFGDIEISSEGDWVQRQVQDVKAELDV